jgi:hypothetical protein
METNPWIAALAAIVVTLLVQGAKAIAPWVAAAPDWVKMVVGALAAGVVTLGRAVTGQALGDDPMAWDAGAWQMLMTWVLAMGVHVFAKKLGGVV